jgi:hypothetical protein
MVNREIAERKDRFVLLIAYADRNFVPAAEADQRGVWG